MAFTDYTIVPEDGVVVLDLVSYRPVDMTGISPTIHAIQWYGLPGVGIIEYKQDPMTGELPIPGSFSDPADYFNQTEACENPYVVYAETDLSTYDGRTFLAGEELDIYQWPWPSSPPPGFTTVAPVGPLTAGNTWQWDGSAFIASPFPISYTLSEAQTALTATVKRNGATHIYKQLLNHSPYEIVTSGAPGNLVPLDSVVNGYSTISAYQAAVDALVSPKLADIAAATLVSDLYGFDPTIPAP